MKKREGGVFFFFCFHFIFSLHRAVAFPSSLLSLKKKTYCRFHGVVEFHFFKFFTKGSLLLEVIIKIRIKRRDRTRKRERERARERARKKKTLSHVLGAPPSVASGSLSTVYLLPLRYITGTPGIFRTRLRRSRSHVATM